MASRKIYLAAAIIAHTTELRHFSFGSKARVASYQDGNSTCHSPIAGREEDLASPFIPQAPATPHHCIKVLLPLHVPILAFRRGARSLSFYTCEDFSDQNWDLLKSEICTSHASGLRRFAATFKEPPTPALRSAPSVPSSGCCRCRCSLAGCSARGREQRVSVPPRSCCPHSENNVGSCNTPSTRVLV